MPEYAFINTVRQEVEQLNGELANAEVSRGVDELAERVGASREVALAALWRASKRHGESLAVFIQELRAQREREVARAQDTTTPAAG